MTFALNLFFTVFFYNVQCRGLISSWAEQIPRHKCEGDTNLAGLPKLASALKLTTLSWTQPLCLYFHFKSSTTLALSLVWFGELITNVLSTGSCWDAYSLQWRHNDHNGVSNHQPHGCLLKRWFRRRSKKTSKLRVTALCVGNSPGPVNSPHKWPVTRKMFPFDDVIMFSQKILDTTISHNNAWQKWFMWLAELMIELSNCRTSKI